jgi:anti-anti-sigma regulatory factor
MLRITTHTAADMLTFQVEGRLVGPWVTELRDCWQKTVASRGQRVARVDLRAVTFVDAAGRELLADLYRQGATLLACDCQMKAIVAEIEQECVPLPPA